MDKFRACIPSSKKAHKVIRIFTIETQKKLNINSRRSALTKGQRTGRLPEATISVENPLPDLMGVQLEMSFDVAVQQLQDDLA